MNRVVEVACFDPRSVPDDRLTYVVMASSYHREWIFVRHTDRDTWEMPAGHIEKGESPHDAAIRELREEAGVVRCSMCEICDYSVTVNSKKEYGRLFLVRVEEMVPELDYEIVELRVSGSLPDALTYPEVQSVLFDRVAAFYSD